MSEPSLLQPLHDLLCATHLSDLVKEQTIVSLDACTTVDEALRTLSVHGLLAAPLRLDKADAEARGLADDDHPIVFLDIRDVLTSFMHDLGHELLEKTPTMLKRMRVLEERGLAFAGTRVGALSTLGADGVVLDEEVAARQTLEAVLRGGFLRAPVAATAPPGRGAHRLGLRRGDGSLLAIVSQTDVVRWLARELPRLPALAASSVASLGLGGRAVVGVRADTPALDALALMQAQRVSAVAVLGGGGALIGNFSVSDLRTILAEHFGSLALPVGEFLAREHGTEYAGYAAQIETKPEHVPGHKFVSSRPGVEVGQDLVTCSASSSLESVVGKLVQNGLHRLYVCDEALKPMGVITLTDILRQVCLPQN